MTISRKRARPVRATRTPERSLRPQRERSYNAHVPHTLSRRTGQTVALYAIGMSYAEIAAEMGITPHSASGYLKRAKAYYADSDRPAWSRAEMFRRACEDGLLGMVIDHELLESAKGVRNHDGAT